ncbi:TetR/AcrR family transcriptional regulator [Nocardia carnea]|uniref:TetR/AcrR family transcriptional regulator n=1 Tax=Nocardia carnea TaxID=37328 RepID=A0ABW7TZB0_9NOCA|nr:TetR/AcrR family transcriptional regulator [Nocardia carnea]
MTGRPRSPRGTGGRLRAEIITATRELLERTGSVEAVSIRAVAGMVGVSAPSIYRHFADKDALIEAAVAEVFEALNTAMQSAVDPADSPPLRLRRLGLAYVRFALDHPEQYRLATIPTHTHGAVDLVLTSGAFRFFATTVEEAMAAGLIDRGDPTPLVLELWAAAHGIASLLLAKPFLPWGDPMAVAGRVLDAACAGHVVTELIGPETGPAEMTDWLTHLRNRVRGTGPAAD